MNVTVYNGNNNTAWTVFFRTNTSTAWSAPSIPFGSTAEFNVPNGTYVLQISTNLNLQEPPVPGKSVYITEDSWVVVHRVNGTVIGTNNPFAGLATVVKKGSPSEVTGWGFGLGFTAVMLYLTLRTFGRLPVLIAKGGEV